MDRRKNRKGKTYDELYGPEKSKELKENLSKIFSKKYIGKNNPFFGKAHTEENKKKFRKNRLGKTYEEIYGLEKGKIQRIKRRKKDNKINRDYWSEYPLIFYDKKLRKNILLDQSFQCRLCSKDIRRKFSKNLHHINYIKKDNRRRNLIYLCVGCHSSTNANRDDWKVYLRKINREVIKNGKLQRMYLLKINKDQSLEFRKT